MKTKLYHLCHHGIFFASLALCVTTAAWSASPDFYFYLSGKQQALTIDDTQVAIQMASLATAPAKVDLQTVASTAKNLANTGITADDVQPLIAHGWMAAKTSHVAARLANLKAVSAHDRMKATLDSVATNKELRFTSPIFRDSKGKPVLLSPGLLVAFKDDVDERTQQAILAAIPRQSRISKISFPKKTHWLIQTSHRNGVDVLDVANALATNPAVKFAEPNFVLPSSTSQITSYYTSWAIDNTVTQGIDMDVLMSWYYGYTGYGVTVLVLDNGVQMNNPALPNVIGQDFTGETVSPAGGPNGVYDTHGTEVASCIAGCVLGASQDGGDRALGAAPYARIASARIQYGTDVNGDGSIDDSSWGEAISWGTSITGTVHARVSNTSLGTNFQTNEMTEAYAAATSATIAAMTSAYSGAQSTDNMVHFAAAGNGGSGIDIAYPARLQSVNAVGAIDSTGALASFSQTGPSMAFAAPGVHVVVAVRNDDPTVFPNPANPPIYSAFNGYFNGTSFASPYCAGVAAILIEAHGSDWPAAAVTAAMAKSAHRLGTGVPNNNFGYGIPDAFTSLVNFWQLYDISSLAPTSNGENQLTLGFAISGTGTKKMLIRGVGPQLSQYGVPSVLSDPVLTLYHIVNGQPISVASNQGWGNASDPSALSEAAASVGDFPLPTGSADSAMIFDLSGGESYTAVVTSASGGSGYSIAEAYDLSPQSLAVLQNLSSRTFVTSGASSTAGFVVQGIGNKQVMIRAVGSTLQNYGINNWLPNPVLTIWKISPSSTQQIATNTNWNSASNKNDIINFAQSVYAFPLNTNSTDSVVLMNLTPGVYTAVVSDANNQAGVLLTEIYQAP